MRNLGAVLLLAACAVLGCGGAPAASVHPRIIGYATRWNAARTQDAGNIDTLIYAFASLVDGRVTLDAAGEARLRELTALKAAYPALKVAISVGGWGAGGFSEAAGGPAGIRGQRRTARGLARCRRPRCRLGISWARRIGHSIQPQGPRQFHPAA